MLRPALVVLTAALLASGPAAAAPPASPYAGEERRAIKALSADEIDALLAGKGLGFAKSAELNGYPGPAHVLELAAQLELDDRQLRESRAIHARMEAQARRLGAELVEAERRLEQLFGTGVATPEAVRRALETIASLQAQLRGAHLVAHIDQRALLSAQQVARYAGLRGYGHGAGHRHGHGHEIERGNEHGH